ncbi:MAG: ArsR family transcriptional regulator [Candidatus Hodarchaeota archaeon]
MTLTDIIHPTRLKILGLMSEGPQNLTDLARNLDISKPEISRHLARMRELNLVEKGDKIHQMTSLGDFILNLTSPIEFLISNYDYFMNHKVDLPFPFIRDVDSLMNSELITGTGYFMSKIDEIRKKTTKEVKMMVDQPFPGSKVQIEEALLIVPLNAKSKNLNLELLKSSTKYFEIRTLPVINLTLTIVDGKYGFLLFPEIITEKIDYNHAFYITDDIGLNFLARLWDHFWERAEYKINSSQRS